MFSGLDVAGALIQGINNGLEGAIAWDLDDAMHTQDDLGDKTKLKRWGMWNSLGTELCNKPEDENLRPWFYTWSLMCRFFPSGMSVVQSKIPENCPVRVVTGAQGNKCSIAILNNSDKDLTILLKSLGMPVQNLFRYLYIDGKLATDENGFPVPVDKIRGNRSTYTLCVPAKSFQLLTNLKN